MANPDPDIEYVDVDVSPSTLYSGRTKLGVIGNTLDAPWVLTAG